MGKPGAVGQRPKTRDAELFRRGAKTIRRRVLPGEDLPNLWRFSLTKFGIPLFYVFRDKRVGRTQATDVLPGLRVEPTFGQINDEGRALPCTRRNHDL